MDNSRPQHLLLEAGRFVETSHGQSLIFDLLISDRFDFNHLVVNVEAENKCQLTNTTAAVEMRVSQISCSRN